MRFSSQGQNLFDCGINGLTHWISSSCGVRWTLLLMTKWRKFKTIYLKVYTDNRHWILWLFLKIWKNPLFRFVVRSWLKLHAKYNFAILCHEQLCNAWLIHILDCPLSMSPWINQLIILGCSNRSSSFSLDSLSYMPVLFVIIKKC